MGCCGEPNDSSKGLTNGAASHNHAIINQQPVPQPGLGKPSIQSPSIPSPPLAYNSGQNGFQYPPASNLTHSTPPPQFNPSTYNGSVTNYSLNEPLRSNSPPHRGSTISPMPMLPAIMGTSSAQGQSSSSPDEGRMSVSIDFGTQPQSNFGSCSYSIHNMWIGTTFSGVVSCMLGHLFLHPMSCVGLWFFSNRCW
jgi:hypothetical protein